MRPLELTPVLLHHAGVSGSNSRWRVGLAVGNLVAAALWSAAGYALPHRYWLIDVPLVLTVLALVASAVVALARPAWADRALRIAAWVLLAFGLLLVFATTVSMGFLSGVHGEFGAMGVLVMALVLALAVPYALAYPVFQLAWPLRRGRPGAAP